MILENCPRCGRPLEALSIAETLSACPACEATFAPPNACQIALLTCSPSGQLQRESDIRLTDEFRREYQLGQLIGSGGMGMVFAAVHLPTGQTRAVKFLVRVDSMDALVRFLAEGRLLAELAHPNVLKVLDVGEIESHPYLVT
ncbi:MAG: hypothetical protein HY815_30620, partial [Candidatus Riflebacteria bacterium]|nr:hypothetical protein [Candidatus Riflebacteria bacterium]